MSFNLLLLPFGVEVPPSAAAFNFRVVNYTVLPTATQSDIEGHAIARFVGTKGARSVLVVAKKTPGGGGMSCLARSGEDDLFPDVQFVDSNEPWLLLHDKRSDQGRCALAWIGWTKLAHSVFADRMYGSDLAPEDAKLLGPDALTGGNPSLDTIPHADVPLPPPQAPPDPSPISFFGLPNRERYHNTISRTAFWEYEIVSQTTYILHYGAIGSKGTFKTVTCLTSRELRIKLTDAIYQKTSGDYRLV